MKKEEYGQHPMTDEEIEAFMNQHSIPPRRAIHPLVQEQTFTISQIIQILANAAGYKVILQKN